MKVVITYGVFDLYHIGHENLLRRAKALGDKLIVGVTSNSFTKERGKLLLADSLDTRMNNVRNCEFVDEVILEDHYGQKIEDIQKYGVDIFVAGDDWRGQFDYLREWCEVVYLPRTPGISSSSLRNAPNPEIIIGMIGNGRVARRFIKDSKAVRGGVRVRYVYNPHLFSAQRFAEENENVTAVEDIEDFFSRVDAVYVATPHETHYGYAMEAISHGKHVLCEKPMALRRSDAEALYDAAAENNVVLMEALKTAYCPGFIKMISLVRSGLIGNIVDVESCFSRLTPDKNGREWVGECGGSFVETGSYTLLPILKILGTEDLDVRFQSIFDENGQDIYTKTFITNKKGQMGLAKNGMGAKSEGHLIVAGTEGYLLADAPWWKTTHFEIRREDPSLSKAFGVEYEGEGLRYELAEFVEQIQGWHSSDYLFRRSESVQLASIMEQFIKYKNENGKE